MAEPPAYEPAPKRSWQVLLLIAALLFGMIAAAIYYARAPHATPNSVPVARSGASPADSSPGSAPTTTTDATTRPPDSLPMQGTQSAPAASPKESRAPTVGRLGIDTATCPSFAEIAARFWELKARGTTIESAYTAIEQGSAGDEKKIKLLKALAQVVYANATPTRELAYRNALEACRKS